jgi:Rrf2 family protein
MPANSQFSMAVHTLVMLARAGDAAVKSSRLAASVNTNAVVIRRLLGQLGHADLVVSKSGAGGGTRLARDPDRITLDEIYRGVACPEVFALHGRAPDQDCPVGRNIEAVLCNLQKEVDNSIDSNLSKYTLKDILETIEGSN